MPEEGGLGRVEVVPPQRRRGEAAVPLGALLVIEAGERREEGSGWPPRFWYRPTLLMQLVDDRGTEYRQRIPGGGGGMGRWELTAGFAPALSADAEELRLTLTELRWDRHDHDTGVTDLHRRDELGWTFTIPLAGRAHTEL